MPRKAKETYNILSRWTGAVQASVEIKCAPDDLPSVKLGLAVQVAHDTRARLDGARLDGARLDGARLDGASLVGASLVGASLDGASLVGARLDRASLVGARLDRARLDRARLDGARLDRASLDRASLDGARLDRASLVGARLDRALMCGEKIKRLFAIVGRLDGYVFYAFEMEGGGYKIKAGCRWQTADDFRSRIEAEYPRSKRDAHAALAETREILDFIAARATRLGISTLVAEPVE